MIISEQEGSPVEVDRNVYYVDCEQVDDAGPSCEAMLVTNRSVVNFGLVKLT